MARHVVAYCFLPAAWEYHHGYAIISIIISMISIISSSTSTTTTTTTTTTTSSSSSSNRNRQSSVLLAGGLGVQGVALGAVVRAEVLWVVIPII